MRARIRIYGVENWCSFSSCCSYFLGKATEKKTCVCNVVTLNYSPLFLDQTRNLNKFILTPFWPLFGYFLSTFRLLFGYFSATFRLLFGYFSAIFQLHTFWVHFDSILTPFWLHFCSILTLFRLQFNSILVIFCAFLAAFWLFKIFSSILCGIPVHF